MTPMCCKCKERPRASKSNAYCLGCAREYHRARYRSNTNRKLPFKARRRHGCTNEPWFKSYEGMIRRASGKHVSVAYAHVTVCDEWRNDPRVFGDWATSNGYRPGLTIERNDPGLGYGPSNCCWIPMAKNVANSHRTSPRAHGADGRFTGKAK